MAQRSCLTTDYIQQQIVLDPSLAGKLARAEQFMQEKQLQARGSGEGVVHPVIRIPVVVHLLYKKDGENLSDQQVAAQLEALNRDFRRRNADTIHTPSRFQGKASDIQIEFELATADPQGRPTSGILRKKTTVDFWRNDDGIKYASRGGSDAWPAQSYLNVWVGNLMSLLGYSSLPGSEAARDGVVINYSVFGNKGGSDAFGMGRTLVHEAGHWLGLKHIWGEYYCGDDGVEDTPPQGNFTPGCPTGFRTSCNNGTTGDMYMNYMDYTSDPCMNLFTEGQKTRMRTLFLAGGARHSFLTSKGLMRPWNEGVPVESLLPQPSVVRLYPVPASNSLTLETGEEWVGAKLTIFNASGAAIESFVLAGRKQQVKIAALRPGYYFIRAERGEGQLNLRFVRL